MAISNTKDLYMQANAATALLKNRFVTLTHSTGVVAYTAAGAIPTHITVGDAVLKVDGTTYSVDIKRIDQVSGADALYAAAAIAKGAAIEVGADGKAQTLSTGAYTGLRCRIAVTAADTEVAAYFDDAIVVFANTAYTITVSAEATDVVTITIQALGGGTKMFDFWLSDADGGADVATAPDGGLAVTTGTKIRDIVANKAITVKTDTSGVAVITATESGAKTAYANIVSNDKLYAGDQAAVWA